MAIKHVMTVSAPLDSVAAVLCSEEYNIEMQQSREDVVSVEYTTTEDSSETLEFELRFVLYRRTKTGGIDRSGKTNTRTVYRYNRSTHVLWWQQRGEEEERVEISGETTLFPDGKGTRIERDVTIDVRIPVIGRGLKKLIEREFKKGFGRVEQKVKEVLSRA